MHSITPEGYQQRFSLRRNATGLTGQSISSQVKPCRVENKNMDATTDLLSGVERHTDRFFGKFRGRVRDNDDPLKLGRIRASVPQILQDQDTGWALPALPYSGQGVGVYTIPAIDAGVRIEFEAGEVSQPIWSGCWWSDGQLPVDEAGTGQTPDMKIIRTEKGLLLSAGRWRRNDCAK